VCAAVSRFFTFQVFATFIYQFVVGAALGRIQEIIKDPTGQIVEILGVSAAQTSSFFMSYIMLNVSAKARTLESSRALLVSSTCLRSACDEAFT
jgi:hypothetical protein